MTTNQTAQPVRVGVATPGGDAPGMNACLRSIVKAARFHSSPTLELVGAMEGAVGLARGRRGDLVPLGEKEVADKLDRAGSVLRSARVDYLQEVLAVKPGDDLLQVAATKIVANCEHHGIEGLILIGGDTTCSATKVISRTALGRLPIVVIPASIDNDVAGTSVTVGFDSAVHVATSMIDRIRQTATALSRTFIIEVMGATSGYIASQVAVASGAEEILVPEHGPYREHELVAMALRLQPNQRRPRSNIVIVAEGIELPGMTPAPDFRASFELEAALKRASPRELQIRTTVLGHLQRGAEPTATTRLLATRSGVLALDTVYDHICRLRRAAKAQAKARLVTLSPTGVVGLGDIPKQTRRRDKRSVLRLVDLQRDRLSY